MGWRSVTFTEMSDLLKAQVPSIKAVAIFNNQLDGWKGAENQQSVLDMPCVLIEFTGGEFQHQRLVRIAEAFIFRLHIVQANYQEEWTGEAGALDHLDFIDTVANAIDLQNLTYAIGFELVRAEQDVSRTNIIEHILEFTARVVDESLQEKEKLQSVTILETKQIVSMKKTEIETWRIK